MHKLQNGSQVSVRPQRKPLVGLSGYFSESNDQGAPSYPGQDWFNDCTDEFLNALAAAGIEYEHGRLDHLARMISGSNFAWLSMPIGSPFPLVGDLPPTDSDAFRYVVLTDADPYNDGVLINKEVSGTAPNLVIKYTIDMPGSPLHGTKIEMLNTMGAIPTPGLTSGVIIQDAIRNITARLQMRDGSLPNSLRGFSAYEGAFFSVDGSGGNAAVASKLINLAYPDQKPDINFDASRVVPTASRNQPFGVSAIYYMRIY
ncbi:TPA: hypothetical protein PX780_000765 [Vibrio cholerae]|nr:hypothetical protein [Vibrio cholerae]